MGTKSCRLKKGSCRRIADQFGVRTNYVTMVKKGSRRNNAILEEIIKEIDFQNMEATRLLGQLNKAYDAAQRLGKGMPDRRANKPRQDN